MMQTRLMIILLLILLIVITSMLIVDVSIAHPSHNPNNARALPRRRRMSGGLLQSCIPNARGLAFHLMRWTAGTCKIVLNLGLTLNHGQMPSNNKLIDLFHGCTLCMTGLANSGLSSPV